MCPLSTIAERKDPLGGRSCSPASTPVLGYPPCLELPPHAWSYPPCLGQWVQVGVLQQQPVMRAQLRGTRERKICLLPIKSEVVKSFLSFSFLPSQNLSPPMRPLPPPSPPFSPPVPVFGARLLWSQRCSLFALALHSSRHAVSAPNLPGRAVCDASACVCVCL